MSDVFDAKAFLKTVTSQPGVYRMYDAGGTVIYVGKAKDLKKRLSSYFRSNLASRKTEALVALIAQIDVTVTHTETEALLLEHNYIKLYQPRYNVLLRDDKSYPFIFLSGDTHPRLAMHRGAKHAKGEYFGPFPNGYAVRETLALLQKIFPIRQCENSVYRNRSRPCLQYQIGRCLGPCVAGLVSEEEYAQQVEYMCDTLHNRENVIVSLHPHNDRGCAVADCEMGLLAGADRIEGTCFGNGERTGNADIVTIALNMYTHGVDPKLDFSDMPALVELYERVTRMKVYDRSPYSGALVFAAFSGSHQDAIAKGMNWRKEKSCDKWTVPYLPIDPHDVGREYDGDVIRINSQSGKGGIGFILQNQFGYDLPKKMREDFGYKVKAVSDHKHKELMPDEVYKIFKDEYLNKCAPVDIPEAHYVQKQNGTICAAITASVNGVTDDHTAEGNGRLDAVANAIKQALNFDFTVETYTEHALERKSTSEAVSYVGISCGDKMYWGVGRHSDIIVSSIKGLVSAINNAFADKK